MKSILNFIPAFLSAFILLPGFSFSQNLTGIWRGYFYSARGEQYKIEVQLEQNDNVISGVTYSYLSTVFYGKATMTGNFSLGSQKALFEEIKTVELKMSASAVPCIMKYNMVYAKSGREEFLEGSFSSIYEKDSYGGKRGDDCGDGRVYLRKVPESDFPLEPFLRPKENKPDSLSALKKDSVKPKTTTTVVKKPATTNSKTAATKPPPSKTTSSKTSTAKPVTTKPVASKPGTTKPPAQNSKPASTVAQLKKPKLDSAVKIEKESVEESNPKINLPKPLAFNSRYNELAGNLKINTEEVLVKLFDNGEIDGDTISVYLDGKLVLSKKRLTAAPLELKLKMDESNDEHELVMVAENLGRIPPNTSLMIVEAGEQRFTVRITSTFQKNAMVRFTYQKK